MTRVSPTVNAWIADELPPLRASTRVTPSPRCCSTHRSVLAGGRRRRKRLRSSSPKPCGALVGDTEFWLLLPGTSVLPLGLEVVHAYFGTPGRRTRGAASINGTHRRKLYPKLQHVAEETEHLPQNAR